MFAIDKSFKNFFDTLLKIKEITCNRQMTFIFETEQK